MAGAIEQRILDEKLIAIVRGIDADKCVRVAEALYAGGIRLIEVTFAQAKPESFPETANAIAAMVKALDGRAEIGAGTVTTTALVDLAADAGAKFIISPDANPDVIRRTKERGLVSIPGAMTPTEILSAHAAGADFVKLFPYSNGGAGYIKAIHAPLAHVPLLAVGGVRAEDYDLRLRIAGISGEKIVTAAKPAELSALVDLKKCDTVVLLFELYRYDEAMRVRDELVKRMEAEAL